MPARAPTDEPSRSLALLCLEICRDPQGVSVEAVAGSWWALSWAYMARKPSIWAELAEAGLFLVAGARLSESSAVEMVNWRCAEGLQAGAIIGTIAFICQLELPGVNQTQLVVENGIADSIASVLKVRRKAISALTKTRSFWTERIRPSPAQHFLTCCCRPLSCGDRAKLRKPMS